MKPIQYIIIAIFVVSGILGYLLYQQKSHRVQLQLDKTELGWNPVSIKKMYVFLPEEDTLWWAKENGIWKSNHHFDGMGTAQQLIIYMSTMQIQAAHLNPADSMLAFQNPIEFCTYDKNGTMINHMVIGNEKDKGTSFARINLQPSVIELRNPNNQLSIRHLLEDFKSMK